MSELKGDWLVTVCDACQTAACWHGVFYCEKYRDAGLKQMTVERLRTLMLESEDYWRRDENIKRKLGTAKPLIERRSVGKDGKP